MKLGDYWIMKFDEVVDLILAIKDKNSILRNNIRIFRISLNKLIDSYGELIENESYPLLLEDFDLILFLLNIDEFDDQGDGTGL